MSSLDLFRQAFEGIRQSLATGRLAHAYLVVGHPQAGGALFAESVAQLLFCRDAAPPCGRCQNCLRVHKREHPDVVWMEPELKSRRISIEAIRSNLLNLVVRKPYEGPWKVAVILYADRLTDDAANALLKTLEEPPGETVILLVTDCVQYLRPTIVSRCQRVVVATKERYLEYPWRGEWLEMLRQGVPKDPIGVRLFVDRLKALLEASAKRIEEETAREREALGLDDAEWSARIAARVLQERAEMFRMLMMWRRDILLTVCGLGKEHLFFPDEREEIIRQAQGVSFMDALEDVRAIQTMLDQLDSNLPLDTVVSAALLRTLPGEQPSHLNRSR